MRADRVISSIPRDLNENAEEKCPHKTNCTKPESSSCPISESQSNSSGPNWVYPSPKMFWESMQRKGTLPAHLSDPQHPKTQEELEWIVTIHNVVNEQCWQEICKWERFRAEGCKTVGNGAQISDNYVSEIKLQRFLGRPDNLSPLAWFKSAILGYKKPFDRHDWYVTSETGKLRRYVIDFYGGNASKSDAPTAFYLDVRPAVDSIDSVHLRIRKFLCEWITEIKEKLNK